MNNVNFDRPILLLVLLGILVVIVISFIISINKENRTKNNLISFIIHIVIAVLVSLSLAKTTYESVVTETNIYVLADVSYSANKNLDLIDEYIKDLKNNVPKNSKIGVICFGKDQELLVELGKRLKSVKEANIDDSETDIGAALKYATTLFEDNVIKRIVIISDGEDTNNNDLVSIVDSMSTDDIYVDAIYIDNNIKEGTKEVQINSVDYTPSTYLNYEENVYIQLQSNISTRAIIKLKCDGEEIDSVAKTLIPGYNNVIFNLDTKNPGEHKYEVSVDATDDELSLNNKYYFSQIVAEKLKVLFIGSSKADKEVASSLYEDAEVTYYINDYDVPFTAEQLCEYDEFVLANIDIRKYANCKQFVNNLDVLVSEFGKSLITIGNTYIQNNEGDEVLTSLSNMLPTKFGNEDKKKTVTILLDVSRSMEQVGRLIVAKQAACTILDKLEDDVKVSCITFYGEVEPLFILKDAKDRETLKEMINNAEPYQGTFLGAALGYTYELVSKQNNTKNEVILISDGLPYYEQTKIATHYAEVMGENNIVLSTIQTASSDAEATARMKEFAALGKGYYSYINEVKDVEKIVLNEVFNSLNETILENQELPVSILLTKDLLVENISSLANIKGIYNNTAKASSKVVLETVYTDIDNTKYNIPLYTYWEYGNGRVASFASQLSGDWVSLWNTASEKQVLKNIVKSNIPSERIDTAYIIENNPQGTFTDIVVKSPTINKDSVFTIKVTYPNGEVVETVLASVIDDNIQKYLAEIKTSQIGEYVVELNHKIGNSSPTTTYYKFYISYLPEYDSFTIYEASSLYYMVNMNGKVSEDGKLVLENNYSNVQKYVIDFTPSFMLVSAILLVVDIMIRKLRLQDLKSLFKKIRKKENN